jgi:N-acyl-D-amino-acid deacylase
MGRPEGVGTGLAEVGGAKNVLLTAYGPDPRWVGKTIAAIATETGRDAVTVIQEIVAKTRGPGATGSGESVVVTAMQEADLKRFLADPRVMFCTDGGLRGSHPRGAGSYPRILGRYVREQRVLPLEEAVRKATSLPARRMGLAGRGVVRAGNYADLVVFDPRTVIDTATTARPQSPPVGISHVWVNGQLVLDNGKVTGARSGMVLRRRGRPAGALSNTRPPRDKARGFENR